MADFDIANDGYNPTNIWSPLQKPSIAGLKAALTAFNATTFSASKLNLMSRNDMLYAARVNGVAVPGI